MSILSKTFWYSKNVSNNKIYAQTSTKQGLPSSTFEASLVRTWPWFSSQLNLLCFSNYSSLFGDIMCRGLRKSRYNLLWKLQKSASLLLSHVPHVSNNHSLNILQFWTVFYRNLIKITQVGRRGEDESKMNLQLPEENSLTSVGLLGSCFLNHPGTSFDIQCIQKLCFPGRYNWPLPGESKGSHSGHGQNFVSEKNKWEETLKKIKKEKNGQKKLSGQTPHFNMKSRHAWDLQTDKEPGKFLSVE